VRARTTRPLPSTHCRLPLLRKRLSGDRLYAANRGRFRRGRRLGRLDVGRSRRYNGTRCRRGRSGRRRNGGNRGNGGDRRTFSTASFLKLSDFVFYRRNDLVVFFGVFEEVGDIKEGVALEADVHEGGLHPGKDFRDPAFINVAYNPLRSMPFNVVFDEFIVLQNGDLCFLGGGGNDQFFLHLNSCAR
jgi:hypothetical protein